MSLWFVYIARCGDSTLYTGITNDLARRLSAHASGRGARYTRSRGGVRLHHWEAARSKGAALRREAAIKKLSRAAKLAMADVPGLRPASADDLPFIRRTLAQFDLDTSRVAPEQFFIEGRRRGFARIKPHGAAFELASVAVVQRHRGKGIASRLVRELVARWPTESVWLVTRIPGFFQRLGFRVSPMPRWLATKAARHGGIPMKFGHADP